MKYINSDYMAVRGSSLHYRLFILLLVINAVMRCHQLNTISFSNDELSAISRLHFQDLSEVIASGVVKTDPHPAGIQVFLFEWTKLFGTGTTVVRLPFVFAGLLSLIFLFWTFRSWFGSQNSLLIITFYSLLEFTLIHGQLARPYAVGILTCSAMVYFWNNLLFLEKLRLMDAAGYVICGILCLLIHYYAGLFAGILGLLGLVYVSKNNRLLTYVVLNSLTLIGFLGHVPITLAQFSRGDLVSWIPPSEDEFLWSHVYKLLNESTFLLILCGIALIIELVVIRSWNKIQLRYLFICFALFIAPIIVGYIYDLKVGHALLDRVFYFSAPYLVVLFFGILPALSDRMLLLSFAAILLVVTSSTIFERNFLQHQYVENFRGISHHIDEIRDKDVFIAGNFNSAYYINYYLWYNPIYFEVDRIDNDSLLAIFMHKIKESPRKMLSLSWACTHMPMESVEYARRYYPETIEERIFYNSGYWLLGKKRNDRDTLLFKNPLAKELIEPDGDSNQLQPLSIIPDLEYLNIIKLDSEELKTVAYLNVLIAFESRDAKGLMLVCEIKDGIGKKISWTAGNFSDFNIKDEKNEIMLTIPIAQNRRGREVNVYIWNPEKKYCLIYDAEISAFADSHYPNLY